MQQIELVDTTEGNGERLSIDIIVEDDAVNQAKVGTQVLATGVVRVEQSPHLNRFDFFVEANYLEEEPDIRPEKPRELQDVIQARWEFVKGR